MRPSTRYRPPTILPLSRDPACSGTGTDYSAWRAASTRALRYGDTATILLARCARGIARAIVMLLVVAIWHDRAYAEETTPAPRDDRTERGRRAYLNGVRFAEEQKWGEALAAFEEAAALRDAPEVQFNIGYCSRILGRYVAAKQAIGRVLRNPTGFDPVRLEDVKAYEEEFERIIVRV